jgi:hypothetical protein
MSSLKLAAAAIAAVLIAGTAIPAQAQVGAGARLTCRTAPTGTRAICRDWTPSYRPTRAGACSHHGGVWRWCDGY